MIARSARDAWAEFVRIGGIEPEGRDKDFVFELTRAIDRDATGIDAALAGATTSELLRAMFDAVAPFSAMFSDILALFRNSDARRGKQNWTLAIADIPFALKDFVHFGERMRSAPGVRELPVIDVVDAWSLTHILGERDAPAAYEPDVAAWLDTYRSGGAYPAFPASLGAASFSGGLADACGLAEALLDVVRRVAPDRLAMPTLLGADEPSDDILTPRGAAAAEMDHWLSKMIQGLAAAAVADAPRRTALSEEIDGLLGGRPRRPYLFDPDVLLLEQLLSLPAWKHRHELYAVWIAAEIVQSLPDHKLTIHDEDGKLNFAFKETHLATFGGRHGEAWLLAERKLPLESPVSPDRAAHVQPDYGIWLGDRCTLVIEVKHYKKSARRKFGDVLTDYAAAHKEAEVLLVNHGPIGTALDAADTAYRSRCKVLGKYTPFAVADRARFAEIVLAAAGPPPASAFLLIDTSGSMEPVFVPIAGGRSIMSCWLESDEVAHIRDVAFIDTQVRWHGSLVDARAAVRTLKVGGGTSLEAPLLRLLADRDEIMIATDQDGRDDIERTMSLSWRCEAVRSGIYILYVWRCP